MPFFLSYIIVFYFYKGKKTLKEGSKHYEAEGSDSLLNVTIFLPLVPLTVKKFNGTKTFKKYYDSIFN